MLFIILAFLRLGYEENLLPPHLADEATPFSISSTLCPAAESLSAIGIPAAPPPTTI
jgi:hypothetical protein